MKRSIGLFLGLAFCFGAAFLLVMIFSIGPAQASNVTPSAKSFADLLENHYRGARSLRAIFLERYSEGSSDVRVESGAVYFERPGRMRWDYESPEKKVFVSDGKTVWFYVPADHTVTRIPAKQSADWREPLALLTGKADLSKLCREVTLQGPTSDPVGNVVLRCLPKGESEDPKAKGRVAVGAGQAEEGGDFTEVLLEINAASGQLARVQVRQKGGVELEYRFGDWKENVPLPDELFRFEPPAGVAIVDGAVLGNTLQ